MFNLKQMPAKKMAYRSVTLEKLLKDQGISYRLNVMGEQSLGAYRVTADTVAALLGKLSQQGIRSFFAMRTGNRFCTAVYCLNATTNPHRFSKPGLTSFPTKI